MRIINANCSVNIALGAKFPDCIVDSCRLAHLSKCIARIYCNASRVQSGRGSEEEAGGEMGSNLGIIGGARGGGMGVRGR